MAEMIATIGALRFALKREERSDALPDFAGRPFAILPDGTEVQLVERSGECYLLVDHRRDTELRTRVEFWECLDRGEGAVVGLYALTNAVQSIIHRSPVAS